MNKILTTCKNINYVSFILFAITFFYLCIHHPVIDPDSHGYIQGEFIRQPLDYLFIFAFHWAHPYQLQVVMWAQSLFTLFSLCYAKNYLQKKLGISNFLILISFLCTLITVCFYYQMSHIDSEGISFPLFILTFCVLLDCFSEKNYKKIVLSAFLISLLILTRTQFYFFYGILFALIVWCVIKQYPKKYIVMCLLIFIASSIFTNILDRTYHYFKHGYFVTEPLAGILTVIQPLYLSTPQLINDIGQVDEQRRIQSLMHYIATENLNQETAFLLPNTFKNYNYAYQEYAKNYNTILHQVCHTFSNQSCQSVSTISSSALLKMNKESLHITGALFIHNIKENIWFFTYKLINTIGNVSFFIFIVILFCGIGLKTLKNNFIENTPGNLFVILSLLIIILNAATIAFAEPTLPEYTCYSQFLLYCLAAFFAEKILFSKRKNFYP